MAVVADGVRSAKGENGDKEKEECGHGHSRQDKAGRRRGECKLNQFFST